MSDNKNKSENLKNAICYIPMVAIFLFLTEKKTSGEYSKHIKYWMMLFWLYVISTTILTFVWMGWLNWLIVLAYIWTSLFLWFKAYNWEKVDVEILNTISDKFGNKK